MKSYCPLLICVLLIGCAGTSPVKTELRDYQIPENWQSDANQLAPQDNWLSQFNNPILMALTEEALEKNQSLKQQAYNVEIAKQQLVQTGARLWPDLDLTVSTGRSKTTNPNNISNRNTLNLGASYEVDLWGKLSDNQQVSQLSLLVAEAQYQETKQDLVGQIVASWFNLVSANQLTILFQHRVDNAKQSLDIIESGYQQGVNKALDVYLSRNELNSEKSNLAQQKAKLLETARILEKLLGRYPSGDVVNQLSGQQLPLLTEQIPLGLPSDVVRRKPELKAAWYQVLSQNATLAYTHKQRFPSFRLTAAVSTASDELSDLLSSSSLAWSLLGGLTAPIFDAGLLKSNEEIARLRLKQQEQTYLNTLYNAFSEVENAVTNESSLYSQFQATLDAQKNALAAETLAFEQYQRGLVTYTTVLDAQDRAFSAQSSLIQIKNQLLINRANLHIALGGDFSSNNTNNQQEDSINE
ncbi:efflux transporter outer membrane subunit [Paraglaciecola aquimarina]|uniref:Efflux transporter outer membrane subunit n=1 Tax=Paraglaciecola algarum TaxID=3050085 RepID=A0ABS9D2T0_9ALTE|nr:efflux transporter outer membrane subunit [Paraglaciecola sp. G1-23]